MKISIIAAIGKNRELGKDNTLLWHIPEDLKRFRAITSGHPIIMGRKTYESIGRPLPNRLNVVITRDPKFSVEGITVVHSLDEAIEVSKKYKVSSIKHDENKNIRNTKYVIPNTDENEVFVIGGGQIFEQAMAIADRLYLTIVDASFDADVFFPEFDAFRHIVSERKSSYNGLGYTFLDLEKSDS